MLRQAAVDGICNYTTDLGGLAQLNNNIDPSSSRDWDGSQVDAGKGMWHNWNNRYDADGNVSECMGKLYMGFRNGTGKYRCILTVQTVAESKPPKSVKFEYLNRSMVNGKKFQNAEGLGCEKDKYNTTRTG